LMGVGIQALVQVAVADGMRGRVMSLYALVFRGFPAIGAVLIGWLAEHIGLRSVFALSAAACMLAWLVVAPRGKAIEAAVQASRME
jgi:MFS family permease